MTVCRYTAMYLSVNIHTFWCLDSNLSTLVANNQCYCICFLNEE